MQNLFNIFFIYLVTLFQKLIKDLIKKLISYQLIQEFKQIFKVKSRRKSYEIKQDKLFLQIKLAQQYDINIYTPFYINKIDFSDQTTYPLQIQINKDSTNVYISLGNSGIMIMNPSGKNQIFQQNLDNNFISCFAVAQDGKYIIAGVLQKLIIYENAMRNSNEKFFQLIKEIDFSTLIFSITYHQGKQILLVSGSDGDVIVYDTQDFNHIKQIGKFITGAEIVFNIQISSNGQWIYLSCNLVGTVVLQLIEQEVNQIQGEGNLKTRQVQLELAAIGQIADSSQFIVATSDNEYLYTVDTFYGLYYSKCKDMLKRKQNDQPLQLNFKRYWPFPQRSPWCIMLTISSDDKYIFIATRAQGIIIYDNSDRENLKLLQLINIDTLVYYVAISYNQQYLYLVNSESIFTFGLSKINLNNDYPNLFNTQHATETQLNAISKTSCIVHGDEEYLIGFFDLDGINIIPYFKNPYNLKTSSMTILKDDTVEMGLIDPSNKYLIFPKVISKNLIGVYQIAPLDNSEEQQKISILKPKLVYNFYLELANISEYLTFSLDRKYAIATFQYGIFVLDTSNILNIKLVFTWESKLNILGKTSGGIFTRDSNWILYTIRLQGVYLLSAKDKKNLQLSDIVLTFGAENIYISENNDKYAYLCDGIKGFAIIDLTKLPKIRFLSRVTLQGKSIYMSRIIQNDQYALLTSYDDGVLALVDMKDKNYPQIISTFGYWSIYSSGLCGPTNNQYIFITSSVGIITLPLVSQVNIHTEVFEVFTNQITGKQTVEVLNKDQNVLDFNQLNGEYTFLVGQQIQFNFAFIYPIDGQKIIGILQYQDYNQYQIPSYMSYNTNGQTLSLSICKEQLDTLDRTKSNLNTILIKVAVPLIESQFMYTQNDDSDKAITNQEQSSEIVSYLYKKNILDSYYVLVHTLDISDEFQLENDFIQKLIDPTSQLSQLELNLVTKQLQNKIKQTLLNSIFLNPLKYYVRNSLILDFNNQTAFITSSYSSSITVTLTIDQQAGRFVNFNYLGVISSISQLQDQITIQGVLENVNKVLQQRILFSNYSLIDQQFKNSTFNTVNLEVIDNINYRISYTTTLTESKFIQFKEPIQMNTVSNLQQQINKQFSENTFYIETDISFTFSQDSFISTNSSKITCEVLYQIGEEVKIHNYEEVTPNLWIQFQFDSRLNFRGYAPINLYGDQYNFKVIVSDGYTQTEDYFVLKTNRIPLFYVFNFLLKVLGPLLAFLGLYNKRYVLYNMIFKNRVTFSNEIIYCNQLYKKQIVLLGKTLEDSQLITQSLFSKINQMNNQNKKLESKMKSIDDNLNSSNKQNKLLTQQDTLKENTQSVNHFNSPKQQKPDMENQKIKNLFTNKKLNLKENSKKFIQQMNLLRPHSSQTHLEKKYLQTNGSTSITSLIQDIFELNLLKQLSNSSNYKRIQAYNSDLKNSNSRIYHAIKASAARYLLNLNKRSFMLYEYIKYYCKNNNQNQNDWYKYIIDIQYQNQRINETNSTIFPLLEIKCEQFLKILSEVDLILVDDCSFIKSFDQIQQTTSIIERNVNINLIKEVLFADVIGCCEQIPSSFQPSVGESIHLDPLDIKFIIAYKKKNYFRCVDPFVSCLNLDHVRYGVSKNMRLPGWIYLDQKHGLISLEGIPERENVDEVLIRIYDMTGYVLKQFELKIIFEENRMDNQQFMIPDEQDYVQQQVSGHDSIRRSQYFMKFYRQYSSRLRQESFQLNDSQQTQAQLINQKSAIDSYQSPNQFKLYEFQKQSNNKNIFTFTKDSVDTFEDLIYKRTHRNNNQKTQE